MSLKEYFDFDQFITPSIIQVLHVFSIFGCVVLFFYGLMKGINNNRLILIVASVILVPIIYLIIRLLLEKVVVVFQIHENVSRIEKNSNIKIEYSKTKSDFSQKKPAFESDDEDYDIEPTRNGFGVNSGLVWLILLILAVFVVLVLVFK
jgi:hypothetical protein